MGGRRHRTVYCTACCTATKRNNVSVHKCQYGCLSRHIYTASEAVEDRKNNNHNRLLNCVANNGRNEKRRTAPNVAVLFSHSHPLSSTVTFYTRIRQLRVSTRINYDLSPCLMLNCRKTVSKLLKSGIRNL